MIIYLGLLFFRDHKKKKVNFIPRMHQWCRLIEPTNAHKLFIFFHPFISKRYPTLFVRLFYTQQWYCLRFISLLHYFNSSTLHTHILAIKPSTTTTKSTVGSFAYEWPRHVPGCLGQDSLDKKKKKVARRGGGHYLGGEWGVFIQWTTSLMHIRHTLAIKSRRQLLPLFY